jgi:uncharacterized membrane protein YgdD (TMEM256/DUF423 family)
LHAHLQNGVDLLQQMAEITYIHRIILLRNAIKAYVLFQTGRMLYVMTLKQTSRHNYAAWTASLLAAGSLAFSPVLFPAFAAKFDSSFKPLIATFTPAGVDSRLAKKFAKTLDAQSQAVGNNRFPFTPAGMGASRIRTMTVAARTDSLMGANAVSVRDILGTMETGTGKNIRLNPSDFRLSSARGWQGFVLPKTQRIASPAPLSDLTAQGNFRLDDNSKKPASRFNTNVTLDKAREAAPSPRGNAASGDYRVDLGGSFSISRKVDVTAGVRYNSERDRIIPQADNAQDSEAVYVGTKIRF